MTKKAVAEKLNLNIRHLKASKGNFTLFKSFFYGGGQQDLMIQKLLERAHDVDFPIGIVESGSHWRAFVGGAKSGSAKDSYDYVTFKVKEQV